MDKQLKGEHVAILGASDRPDRYAYKAFQQLRAHGHRVSPVHPRLKEIDGVAVVATLQDIDSPVDTVTLYVNPSILEPLIPGLVATAPRRVLFNPGTESGRAARALKAAGIEVEEACTLVLLSTGAF